MLFPGLSRLLVASVLQNYLQLAEPKYSTAFDKNQNHLCGAGCVCADCQLRPEQQIVVSANFRDSPHNFPQLSTNFHKFLRLFANVCDFLHLSLAQ